MVIGLAFLVGLGIGSFINVLTDGIIQGQSITKILGRYRSVCDHCRRPLRWFELIPVASYIALRGKCPRCRRPIPLRYTIVELIAGFLVLGVVLAGGGIWGMLVSSGLILTLLALAIVDIRQQMVPDSLLIIALIFALAYLIIAGPLALDSAFAGVLVSLAVFVPFVFGGRGEIMGEADILIAVILGLWLGYPLVIVAIFMTFIIGGLAGAILVASGLKKRDQTIGLIPYLTAGAMIAYLYGPHIINWYLGMI